MLVIPEGPARRELNEARFSRRVICTTQSKVKVQTQFDINGCQEDSINADGRWYFKGRLTLKD